MCRKLTSHRYNYELQTSEMFSTAGRTVKSGLVASAVVSSWTWAATLLQSSAVAYNYGVSGPFWYASGATVQIILFATIAIELKRRAPNAHTFLEVIRARYGAVTHIVFMVFGLFTNILVTSMLLTGGSAVVTSVSFQQKLSSIEYSIADSTSSRECQRLLRVSFCPSVSFFTLCSVVSRLPS
jgi:Na+/proline symporter